MNKFKNLQLFEIESTCLMLSNGKGIIVFLHWSMKSMTLLGKRNERKKYLRKDLWKLFWRCFSILVQDQVDNLVEQLLFPQWILGFLLFEREFVFHSFFFFYLNLCFMVTMTTCSLAIVIKTVWKSHNCTKRLHPLILISDIERIIYMCV